MKLLTLIGLFIFSGNFVIAQEDVDTDKECTRFRFLANEALKVQNYQEAAMYYLKAEENCAAFPNYTRLVACLKNTINVLSDATIKTAYIDTILSVYDRMETKGLYKSDEDLSRASYILQGSNPNRTKADTLFKKGIEKQGVNTNEGYISYYYFNTYSMYAAADDAKKPVLKKRMINDYFSLLDLIGKANMSARTQETVIGYFNYVVKDCDDFKSEINEYLNNMPKDSSVRSTSLSNFIKLMESKECTEKKEYESLVLAFDKVSPSVDSKLAIASLKAAKKQYSAAISAYREALKETTDEEKKAEIAYKIAYTYFISGAYSSAYNAGVSVGGSYKGKGLELAGKAVGANANNCGSSTFERKCNYIYAVQLLEKARALGENTGGTIASFSKKYPTTSEVFDNGSPSSVSLSCYGVSVNPK